MQVRLIMVSTPRTPAPGLFIVPESTPTKKNKTLGAKRLNAQWTGADLELMFAHLEEAKEKGNTLEGEFTASVWMALAAAYDDIAKTARSCEIKFARMKKDFEEVKWLRAASGFGWDEKTQCVTAEASVWAQLEKV